MVLLWTLPKVGLFVAFLTCPLATSRTYRLSNTVLIYTNLIYGVQKCSLEMMGLFKVNDTKYAKK